MDSQQFLLINIIIIVCLLLLFLSSRKDSALKTTRLSMNTKNPGEDSTKIIETQSKKINQIAMQQQKSEKLTQVLEPELSSKPEKSLNIIFNYNGHSWDAYEVLGVPAGSDLPIVTAAFQKTLKETSSESVDFFTTAYHCILSRY